MELKSLQQAVDLWIKSTGKGYFSELTNMALLTEEVGELARVVARIYGDQVAKKGDLDPQDPTGNLREEIADVLWVLTAIANQTGVDLDQAFTETLRKKSTRDASRFK